MNKNGIRFDELRDLLISLGFLAMSRNRFEHPSTGTILLFRQHGPRDVVDEREMLVVRRQLIDNGLIEPTVLDRFLNKVSA
jgi:hypothetical protein